MGREEGDGSAEEDDATGGVDEEDEEAAAAPLAALDSVRSKLLLLVNLPFPLPSGMSSLLSSF